MEVSFQRLSYKADVLCTTASQPVKDMLDTIFITDPHERPTAKQLTGPYQALLEIPEQL